MGAMGNEPETTETTEIVILLAEDDHLVRSLIRNVLSVEGYKVLSAVDGQEALELSRGYEGAIHLLVSDIKMPNMDGLQLINHVQKERPEIKILLMSGKLSGEIPVHYEPDSFLRKPFLAKTLRSAVKMLL